MRKMTGRGAGPSVDTTCLKTEDGDTLTDPEERAAIFLETYDLSSNKGPILTNICPLVREKGTRYCAYKDAVILRLKSSLRQILLCILFKIIYLRLAQQTTRTKNQTCVPVKFCLVSMIKF